MRPSEAKPRTHSLVLVEVLAAGPTTRVAIADATGLSGPTITRVIDKLIEEGLVRELDLVPASGRGRRAVLIDVVADRALAVGIELSARHARFVALDLLASIVVEDRVELPRHLDGTQLASWLASVVRDRLGELWPKVKGIAVGVPGAVHPSSRAVANAPHLPQTTEPEFLEELENKFGMRIEFENDANNALLGERHFGAARSAANCVMFTIGAGLGAGISVNGHLFRGAHGLVGEFGSLPVGPLGTRLEHLVTTPGILLRASELGIELDDAAELFAESSNPSLLALRRQFDQAMIVAVTAAVVASDPEVIVLGGEFAFALEQTIDVLRDAVEQNLGSAPRIVAAELGNRSGTLGAGVQGLHRVYVDRLGLDQEDLARVPPPLMSRAG